MLVYVSSYANGALNLLSWGHFRDFVCVLLNMGLLLAVIRTNTTVVIYVHDILFNLVNSLLNLVFSLLLT